jgi:hypothetical protein
MQSVPITTNVVRTNPTHCEVYSIQYYVIKLVSDLQHVGGFLLVLIINPKCSLTRKGYNGMPLHVMEQPPRFFALAYRVSDACIYQK